MGDSLHVRDETLVRHWNRLCVEVVDAPPLEVFEARLDGSLSIPAHGTEIRTR